MEIKKSIDKRTLTVQIIGEVDSVTSPILESSLKADINKVDNLILDLDQCTYVSSAGLRIFLAARKHLSTDNEMTIINASPSVMDVLELTGFTKILNIEKK